MALPPGLSPRGEPNSVITTTSNETISGGSDQVVDVTSYLADLAEMDGLDGAGIMHFADDGVVRSYDGNGKVVDYVRLTNAQLLHSITYDGSADKDEIDQLTHAWTGVDGHDVSDATCLNPPTSVKPARFRTSSEHLPGKMGPPDPAENHPLHPRDISSNAALEVKKSLLGKRLPHCFGEPCDSNSWCVNAGCYRCGVKSKYFVGGCFWIEGFWK